MHACVRQTECPSKSVKRSTISRQDAEGEKEDRVRTGEAQAAGDAGHDGADEVVQVAEGGRCQLQRPEADVVQRLVIKHLLGGHTKTYQQKPGSENPLLTYGRIDGGKISRPGSCTEYMVLIRAASKERTMHSSAFSTSWWTERVALYGSTTVSDTCIHERRCQAWVHADGRKGN